MQNNNCTDGSIIYVSGGNYNQISNNSAKIILASSSEHNTIINNRYVGNGYGEGIHIEDSNYNTAKNNFYSNVSEGIYIRSSSYNWIENNRVYNSTEVGIEIVLGSHDNTVIFNTCAKAVGGVNNGDGIEIHGSTSNTIKNNLCQNNSGRGIHLYTSDYNLVENNSVIGNGMEGILMEYSSHNRILNNTVKDNDYQIGLWDDSSSYEVSYNIIDGNHINNSGNMDGIYIYGSGKAIGNVITNNTITGGNTGMRINGAANTTIKNNAIQYVSGNYGIFIYGSANFTIENNTVYRSGEEGIYISKSSSIQISNNTIERNYGHGIFFNYTNNSEIKYNKISNNTGYGVYIESGNNNTIYMNKFYFNHGSGSTFNSAHVQAYDNGSNNRWNSSGIPHGYGNYWHDWANNNDTNDQSEPYGIVDWPYPIDGGKKDYYPLTTSIEVPEFGSFSFLIPLAGILLVGMLLRRKK